eukprot:1151431-Pelagomonas_calceolata.AAC.3
MAYQAGAAGAAAGTNKELERSAGSTQQIKGYRSKRPCGQRSKSFNAPQAALIETALTTKAFLRGRSLRVKLETYPAL